MAKVCVQQGWLSGEKIETSTGDGYYYSFKGIPYARPPVGSLRFKAPHPPLPWDGVRDAKAHGPRCPQLNIFTNQLILESEDCLYLNVYTPNLSPGTPLPVMFFIHGGAFKSGSGNDDIYGPDFLVSHAVVLVTINYRLDALGFLCLDTAEVPGNAGLKDQVAALRWVRDNISKFGGDPQNVTLFGESSGGSSTCLHIISPMAKGLFNKAIVMSGSLFNDCCIPFLPQKRAFQLGKQLGFDTNDPDQLLKFLQSVPFQKLVDTCPMLLSFEKANNSIYKGYVFTPVVEKNFGQEQYLDREILETLKNGATNNVDLFIGYTDNESLFMVSVFEKNIEVYKRFSDLVVPRYIIQKCLPEMLLEISNRIHNFYFKGKSIRDLDRMKEIVEYHNYVLFVCDILRFISYLSMIGNRRRYLYKFCCVSNRNNYGFQGYKYGLHGASHMDDLMYLFDSKRNHLKVDKPSKEYELIQFVCKIFTNFAKYGNPTPDDSLGTIWPEYDNTHKAYMEIKDTLVPGTDPEAVHMEFWKSIYDYAGLKF